MLLKTITAATLAGGLLSLAGAEVKTIYENNFEKAEVGKAPAEMMVLLGDFTVKEEAGNRFLELPGAPVDSYAVLFGPAQDDKVTATARVYTTAKDRRFTTFGLGLNGQSGYRIQVSPSKKTLELGKTESVQASVPYEWKSGEWTHLALRIVKVKDGQWRIDGKAWAEGQPEPAAWMIGLDDAEKPHSGRAGIYASPYAGTDVRFDDLRIESTPNP